MAMYKVFAMRDSAVAAYNRPFFTPHTGQALRMFTDEVNRRAEDNPLWKHPQDFILFELGSWNEEDAKFTQLEQPLQLIRAIDVRSGDDGRN